MNDLTGLFGHTFVPDPDGQNGEMNVRYQIHVYRRIDAEKYLVKRFSWIDQLPMQLQTMTETELLGPTVKLYTNRDDWYRSFKKERDRQRTALPKRNEESDTYNLIR
jgi:hypothetical protein